MAGWWAGKVRQVWRHVAGRVAASERAELAGWLTPAQLALFDSMHRADQRHGLDVRDSLRRAGHAERDLLLAALLHDCGKGPRVGLWHRVGWSLAERYGAGVARALAPLPGFSRAFALIDDHPRRSAELALAAGCSPLTADLILHQAEPAETELARALQLADAAN